MFEIIHGDILDASADYICHQVNCRNAMGAGVAKALYTKWPEVKEEYHRFCKQIGDPQKLLGRVQMVRVAAADKTIVNIFGQLNYGREAGVTYTDYRALQSAFIKLNQLCVGKCVAFPYGFGCGLAGGDWIIVESLMLRYLCDCNVTIYFKE